MSMLGIFAAESEGPHISIAPEKLFEIGGVSITNSMFYGWICAAFLIFLFYKASRLISLKVPRGPAQAIDYGAEFVLGMMSDILGSRARAVRYAPIFMTIFFFILFNNWLGLLPGVGPAVEFNGSPLLRPFTADLNATLGMALVGMFFVESIAIRESGPRQHLRHFFAGNLWNPLTYLVGIFELFTEFTRLFSLGLRLFANVAIGEILIGIFAYLGGYFGPITALPFTLLEIFVAGLQAYIFVLLCLSYLALAIEHKDPDDGMLEAREPVM